MMPNLHIVVCHNDVGFSVTHFAPQYHLPELRGRQGYDFFTRVGYPFFTGFTSIDKITVLPLTNNTSFTHFRSKRFWVIPETQFAQSIFFTQRRRAHRG